MRILFILLGSFSILYFIGIVLYAGLSSLFPCIWAAAGIVCYAIAILLRLETTHHWNILSIFPKPVKAVCLTLAILVILAFLITEGLIFSGMLQKPSKNLDTLIVLGAQVNGTKLSNSLKLRLERAKEYLNENPETIAVVSGGKGSKEEISEAEAMYEYLVSQGIDETRLIKEDRSTNTNENLKYSLALLEEKSNKKPEDLRIGIVTNGFHVFRGTSIGKKMGCRQIEGVPAKSNKFLQLNYLVRECLGIWKDKLVGNL